MFKHKQWLYAGTAAAALSFGLAVSGPAQAFEEVNWSWDKDVVETVDIDVDITSAMEPVGLTEVEKLQVAIGNQTATATLGTFNNAPPAEGGTVDGTVTFEGSYEDDDDLGDEAFDEAFALNGDQSTEQTFGSDVDNNQVETGGGFEGGTVTVEGGVNEGSDVLTDGDQGATRFVVTVEDLEVAPDQAIDATTELPVVEVAATALANSETIESETATTIHEGQFAFGGFSGEAGAEGSNLDGVEDANTHIAALDQLLNAGGAGAITPAQVSAVASADAIANGQADISAQAIANNHSIDVNAASEDDGVLIADLTQGAFADSVATASLNSSTVENYTNLREIGTDGIAPVANVSATAAGNVSDISVGFDAE
ncbi:MAG: hypothetical protein TEF_00640 [Rhizobiales bacterium NRL2]|jgi:hypothetical protein|nr:MAG: hypothetical protein TEF_00640 [Rhizobiales bacterium NRL2]